jgi:hypothetical protein
MPISFGSDSCDQISESRIAEYRKAGQTAENQLAEEKMQEVDGVPTRSWLYPFVGSLRYN